MNKYTITWIESHNPNNWGGLKNLLDTFSYIQWEIADDGWVDGDCKDTFEAENIEEAKEYIRDNYDCEVFSVFENNNFVKPVLIEEDF